MRALRFFLMLTIPLLVFSGVELGGPWRYALLGFMFGPLQLLDALIGSDAFKPSGPGGHVCPSRLHDLLLFAWMPIQLGVLLLALVQVATGTLAPLEIAASVLSLGLMNGAFGLTVAHELLHRGSRAARGSAYLLLTAVSYPHFYIEHRDWHHRWVCTPLDPSTARLGESYYAFLTRTIPGVLRCAIRLEAQRLQRRGRKWLSPHNRLLHAAVLLALVYAAITLSLGWAATLVFGAQSFIAITLLEGINYIQHYGLERRRDARGRYEAVRVAHAWNSSARLTNWFLINLQRHSDHHISAGRAFHRLRNVEEAPQLPASYSAMILLVLIPPIWRRVMDPRVLEVRRSGGPGPTDVPQHVSSGRTGPENERGDVDQAERRSVANG